MSSFRLPDGTRTDDVAEYSAAWKKLGADVEVVTMTEDEFESRLCEELEVGRAVAYENLSNEFLDRAGKAFASCLDEKALWLRELAGEFAQRAVERREKQDRIRREREEGGHRS